MCLLTSAEGETRSGVEVREPFHFTEVSEWGRREGERGRGERENHRGSDRAGERNAMSDHLTGKSKRKEGEARKYP